MIQQTTQSSYRYINLTAYILAALVNSLPVHTFSSINSFVEQEFQLSKLEVTLNALLFTIMHPLFAFPCTWFLNKYGMRVSFYIGGSLVISGVWLRLLLTEGHSEWCLLGSGLAAIGNIFILNSPSKLAANWFRTDAISNAVFASVLASIISNTIGASVPGLIINTKVAGKAEVYSLLRVEAIIVTVPYILLFVLFREKPKIAPSKAAQLVNNEKMQYSKMLKSLFSNREYLKMLAVMSLNYGTLIALITTLDQLLKGLSYSDPGLITGQAIISAMFIGVLGNPLISILLKKTKAYKLICSLVMIGGCGALFLLEMVFYERASSLASIVIFAGLAGLLLIPVPSLVISFASELIFPLDEGSSTGFLLAGSQSFGFVLGLVGVSLIDSTEKMSLIIFAMYTFLLFIAFLFALMTKQDLKRLKYEEKSMIKKERGLLDSLIVQEGLS